MNKALKLAVLMVLQYILLCANMRFVAQGRIPQAVGSDIAIAFLGWTLVRSVATADTWQERAGYVTGAAIGSAIGIWLT